MKTAVYIDDGLTQLVLTPETELEKAIVSKIDAQEVAIHRGGFYEYGDSIRQCDDGQSLIIVMNNKGE